MSEFNLEVGEFADNVILRRDLNGGEQTVFRFDNGLGASVVQHEFSYGGDRGEFELAVVEFFGDESTDYAITYDTPITDDVCGYLSNDVVFDLLSDIRSLEG